MKEKVAKSKVKNRAVLSDVNTKPALIMVDQLAFYCLKISQNQERFDFKIQLVYDANILF
ncbi:hypothetical protein AN168_16395 [Vibrio splendidus]|uniref:Uncharacterized protein n=1 Tax=Vibrio splendidus TaxID=29497 RepID=A0A837NTD1_VIBSP|nr:hypothetical protein AN168_16395 [Vibrio splendidus]